MAAHGNMCSVRLVDWLLFANRASVGWNGLVPWPLWSRRLKTTEWSFPEPWEFCNVLGVKTQSQLRVYGFLVASGGLRDCQQLLRSALSIPTLPHLHTYCISANCFMSSIQDSLLPVDSPNSPATHIHTNAGSSVASSHIGHPVRETDGTCVLQS